MQAQRADSQGVGSPQRKRPLARARRTVTKSPVGTDAIRVAERQAQVWELRRSGMTIDQISRMVGVSPTGVRKDLRRVLDTYGKIASETADEARQIELERLDRLTQHWLPRADGSLFGVGEVEAAKVMLKISERRARLLGLDAPTKTEAKIEIEATLDYILQLGTQMIDANAAEREAFLSGPGKPVPLLDGPDDPVEEEFLGDDAGEQDPV